MGALSITGVPAIKAPYEPLVPGSVRVAEHEPVPPRRRSIPPKSIAVAIEMEGPETVAAVFLEPVQNSGGCFPPGRRLLPTGARDLRRDRRAARLRRGHLRVRPPRPLVRLGALRIPARHHHDGEGHDVGVFADRRHDRAPAPRRTVPARRQDVPARHHVRRSSRELRGRAREPRSDRTRRPARHTCARTRARSARRSRSSTTFRSSATCAAPATSTGIELVKDKATRETFDADESERLLRGFLSRALYDAGLICRADDRGDPVIQLAPPLIDRPARVRLHRAGAAQGAHRSVDPHLMLERGVCLQRYAVFCEPAARPVGECA